MISIIAMILALNPKSSILSLVSYAWGGFGAAFGPIVLMALFSKKTTWKSALLGMITGAIVCVLWKQIGLGSIMYEIVPGFIANFFVIIIYNIISPQDNQEIIDEFNSIKSSL